MPARTKAYIRRPASNELGIAEGYIEVDPSTLQFALLTELYTLMPTQVGGRRTYQRLHGVSHAVNTGIDPSELLETWAGHVSAMETMLVEGDSSAGQFSSEIKGILVDLPQILKLVAAGELNTASNALDGLAYRLMAAIGTANGALASLDERDEQFAAVIDVVSASDQRLDDESLAVAVAIDEGLGAFRMLRAYELEIDQLDAQVMPAAQVWHGIASGESEWLRGQMSWLSGDDNRSFCTRASRYLMMPDENAAETMASAIAEARERIREVRERVDSLKFQREELIQVVDGQLDRPIDIVGLTAKMRKTRETVSVAERHGFLTMAMARGLLEESKFHEWQGLLDSSDWRSLEEVRVRLREKVKIIRDWTTTMPVLSEEHEAAIDRARRYIDRLQVVLTDFDIELDGAAEAADLEAELDASAKDGSPPVPEEDTAYSLEREEELYELIMAVGAVKYCNQHQLTGGYFVSFMDILELLDRVKHEERAVYSGALEKRLRSDSRVVAIGEKRKLLWLETDPAEARWIQFLQKRGTNPMQYTMWRLVQQAQQDALGLLVKYGLTPREIEEAFTQRRERKSSNYKRYKEDD